VYLAFERLGGFPRAQKGGYRACSGAVLRAHFNLLCRRTARNGGREPTKLNTSLVQHVVKIKQPRDRSCVVVRSRGAPAGRVVVESRLGRFWYISSAQGLITVDACAERYATGHHALCPAVRHIRRSEHALLGPAETRPDTTVKSQVSVVDSEHQGRVCMAPDVSFTPSHTRLYITLPLG
jgi:hypothetical protein